MSDPDFKLEKAAAPPSSRDLEESEAKLTAAVREAVQQQARDLEREMLAAVGLESWMDLPLAEKQQRAAMLGLSGWVVEEHMDTRTLERWCRLKPTRCLLA